SSRRAGDTQLDDRHCQGQPHAGRRRRMNGVHDMGGMQDMGAIRLEPHEPTFHTAWEGRVYALSRALRARGGQWNLDSFRHGIELLPPTDYLRMTYYERWFAWIIAKLVS